MTAQFTPPNRPDGEFALTGFQGKVAVVTGAGRRRGIGRSTAVLLARAGCSVVVTGSGRDPSTFPADERAVGWRDVDSVAEEIRAFGGRSTALTCDIADPSSVGRLAAQVRQEFGRLDILVNNAGAAKGEDRRPVLDVEPALWRHVLEVNLVGTFQVSRALGAIMVDSARGGAIVNITSIAGKRMTPGGSAYAASKAGVHALTGCMAAELATERIRVNAVAPGIVDTSRLDAAGRGEAWQNRVREFVPLGRAGTGEDIAATVGFLCSDQAAWITGQTYLVDGGSVRQH